jgi:hypothetical protein
VHLTQVGRVLAELKIEHIPSYSPEGCGRMERVFGALQQRLPPLLRLHGIATMAAANRYLREVYIAEHNRRFAVAMAEPGSAFVPLLGALRDILRIRHERIVGNDNIVRYAGRVLQIPEERHRRHFVTVRVQVHEYPDDMLAVFHGPRRLAGYHLWTPPPGKGKRWDRCSAWSDAVICPALDAAGRQPPACMGVRGLGPDHPERACSTLETPGCPSPVSPTVAPYSPFAHPYASRSRSAYTAATGAL